MFSQMKEGMRGDREVYGSAWRGGHRGSLNLSHQAKGINCQAAEYQCEVLDGETGNRMKGR